MGATNHPIVEYLGIYPRGGVIRIALDFSADAGERMDDIDLVEADVRFAGEKPAKITDDMPLITSFEVETRPDEAGWFLTIEDSAALDLGYYVADVRLTVGGEVSYGQPASFLVTEPVTQVAP